MPCQIAIKDFLSEMINNEARKALSMNPEQARNYIKSLNEKYGEDTVIYLERGDTPDYDIYIPQTLVDNYYESELMIELREMQMAENEAKEIQKEDAERAGEEYTDEYLFDSNGTKIFFTKEQLDKSRDIEIANRLGEKFKQAFKIDYQIITPSEAAVLLQDSPTPYTPNVSAFYYGNKVYFISGRFTANNVMHEFAHPLVKGISYQNPKLFNSLYGQLVSSTTGQNAIAIVKERYPELEEGSPRFMEEAIVTAMEIDADNKLKGIKESDSLFEKFIQNLLYAIKKVIKALTNKVNLSKLDTTTTREQLVDMMLNEDFVIEDLSYQASLFADFKKDTDEFLKELKSIEPKNLVDAINRFHDEMSFQLGQLRISPKKLREELGKDGINIIKNIKDYVGSYRSNSDELTDEELDKLIEALQLNEQDLKLRSLSFINSLSELELFARKINNIFNELKKTNKHLTEEGNQKIQYFKEFMERESKFLKDISKILGLDPANELSKKILSIKAVIENNIETAADMTTDFMKKFFVKVGDTMQKNVKSKLEEQINTILKASDYSEQEIETFTNNLFDKLDVEDVKYINVNDLLSKPLPTKKYLDNAIKNYQANKITEASVDAYLRGHVRDVSAAGAMLNPMGNVNDLFGAFSQFMRDKLSDQEVKTLQKQMKMVENLKANLNAVGYNANSPNQLAEMVLFVDKVGEVDENGEFKEYEIYSFIDKFKNWRADKDKLEFNLKKAKDNNDKDAIKTAMDELNTFNKVYMNRRFTDEVYEVQDIWKKDNTIYNPLLKKDVVISKDIAFEAYMERKAALDDLRTYNSSSEFTELDDLLEFTASENVKTKYNELYNLYDNDGKYKQGVELDKVLVRRYHREQSRKFNESITNTDKFQLDFDHFVNVELAGKGVTKDATPDQYEAELEKFFNKNLKIAYTDEYYQSKKGILEEIKKINEKGKESETSKKLADLYEQRYNIVNRVTDKDGEPNGLELGLDTIKRLKQIELDIVEAQEQFDKKTGLTKEEAKKLRYYEESIIAQNKFNEMTPEEKAEYNSLIANKKAFGMAAEEISYLRNLYRMLADLTETSATDYYVTSFTKALGDLKIEELTVDNAESWINSSNLLEAKAKNSRFAEWFDRNHYSREIYDVSVGGYVSKYYRLKVWSVSKPTNPEHYKTTEIKDPLTGDVFKRAGVPIAKYSYTKIKDQYKTGYNPKTQKVELEVGVHIDNKGNFLPKEFAVGSANGKYMNEKYYQLKSSNNAQFKLLEKLKRDSLSIQEESPYSSRMYLDFPRFRKQDNLEYLSTTNLKKDIKDKSSDILSNVKSWVMSANDDAERGLNFDTKHLYIKTDLQGNPISRVPVRGLYKMNVNDVSPDILRSLLTYGYSLDKQSALIEYEPIANAYLNTLADPNNALDRLDVASSVLAKAKDGASMFLKRSNNQRLQLAKDYIDRTFYGKNVSEWEQDNVKISKVIRGLMSNARFSFYSLNPVSTLKNKLGMDFQKFIYTAGGKHISWSSMARGTVTSVKTVMEYAATGAYAKGVKSLNLQVMDAFDMSPGKAEKNSTDSASRTAVKDLLNASWLYSDRKLTELQGALDLGFSILEFQTVDQVQPDGSVKQIRYAEAFETDKEGLLKLKDGINPEWGINNTNHTIEAGDTIESIAKKYNMSEKEIAEKNSLKKGSSLTVGETLVISTNKKFNEIKRRIASANKKLNGTMAKIDSPIGEKYLLYDVFTFSRKFGTGMFLSRYQSDMSKENRFGEVWDWDLDESNRGKYIQFLATTKNLITDYKNYWPIMTKEEKSQAYEVITEGMMLVMAGLLITYLFGYSSGDEDRFAKMKMRQERYGVGGWLANHALYQLIMVQRENQSFIPIPGVGMDEWLDFTETSSIVVGPTLSLYSKIVTDLGLILTGSDKAIYKQEVGPYSWQKEGSYKIWNHIGQIFGMSGKNVIPPVDEWESGPIWAIKKAEIFENLR